MKRPYLFPALSLFIACVLFAGALTVHGADYFELRDGLSNSRLVFEQTQRGRVAFMGGSITDNKGWRQFICADIQRRFPGAAFDFINAARQSHGSTPDAFRFSRDVTKNGTVDLLFLEAAVNDKINRRSNIEQVRAVEGIVRHARRHNPNIDIIIMHFADPWKNDDYHNGRVPEVIQNHEKVAQHYRITTLNLAHEVAQRVKDGEFSWSDDFKGLHPSPFGQNLYFKSMATLLDRAWQMKDPKSAAHALPEKLDAFCYDNGQLLSPQNAKILQGFALDPKGRRIGGNRYPPGFNDVPQLVGEQPGDSFEMTFKGSTIGLWHASGALGGIIEYHIDDGEWCKEDLYNGWGGSGIPFPHILAAELDSEQTHKLTVRISGERNPRSKGTACHLICFTVNAQQE